MAFTLNEVTLMGHLGTDPEMKYLTGGDTAVTKFSMATDRFAREGDEAKTDWHNITCWNKTAEACNTSLQKGDKVLVKGRIQYSTVERQDGSKMYFTDIIANQVYFLSQKNGD